MKNKIILTIILLFIPFIVLADDLTYDMLDIRINFNAGIKSGENNYSIYASTNEKEELTDRTSEFEISIIKYFRLNSENKREDLSNVYTFKENERYGFEITNLVPKNGALLNLGNIDKIRINSEKVDNSLLEYSIKDNKLNIKYSSPEIKKEVEEVISNPIEEKEEVEEEPEDSKNKCLFGVELCCKEYKGISYCVLGIVALVLIIVIIAIINIVIDKVDDKKYKEF